MAAILEATAPTLPLGPEQVAVGAIHGVHEAPGEHKLLLLADLDGELDAARLESAVRSVSQSHLALRSAVLQVSGFRGLRQQVVEGLPRLHWQPIDLRASADSAAALADWIAVLADEPLDLAHGAPLRAGLARIGDRRHKLVLIASVLAADKGSLQFLLEQVARAYLGEHAADADELFQYPQFVEWRQELASGDEAADGRAYWRSYIDRADALQAPRLNTRMDRPGASEPVRQSLPLDAELASRVYRVAEDMGYEPGLLLQSIWWLLVARLTGHRPFVAGWQHDCRRDYEVMQGAIGVFEKILPVVVDVGPDEGFTHWLARLGRTAAAHAQAQEYWAIEAPPTTAHLATGFAFDEMPSHKGGALAWHVECLPGPMPCFELALQAQRSGGALVLSMHADASRYSPQAVERMLWQYKTLLEAALAQPDARVDSFALVGARERELLLASRGVAADFGARTLAEQVAHWAAVAPDAPALEAGDARLSYRAFDERVNRMAHWLKAQGAAAGTLVALNLPRSADLLVAMLAIWRIGAGYLPLDPEWPEARRQAVLKDAAPSLVLHARAPEPTGDAPWRHASLGQADLGLDLGGFPDSAPAYQPAMGDLAYVLYTSGSTGTPKGVMIEQGQVLNYVAAASAAMNLSRCRRWALTSSVVTDLGNTALFGAFHNGACLVVAGPGDTRDGRAFAAFMRERRIDALKMVPSHLEALLEDDAPRLPDTLVLGGEAAPGTLIERIARLAPQCAVYNHYGPTETTVGVMVHRVSADDAASLVLPLSRVLANSRIHVLDESMRLVPSGALGAVYIGGAQMCRGYLNRQVEGAFVADPFQPGQKLYRTGDLACVLPEGGIRLAGRADDQVKIRGFRVEPAEVEAVLLSQPGVRQAVVLALPSDGGGAELAAFVVGGELLASQTDRATLTERLGALLPAHMVPARYTFLAEFARLPNGKVDRQQLLAAIRTDGRDSTGRAPRDALEAVLVGCMAQLVQRETIGAEDDFFELGGHSLLVIKLVARIRKLLRMNIPPGLVFDHPSAAALAAALRAQVDLDIEQMEQLAQSHAQVQAQGQGSA